MTLRDLALKLRPLIEKSAKALDDTDALDGKELYPMWDAGIQYTAGERIRYGLKLYKVVQAHTSQTGWEPDKTPALFTEVAKPGEIPVWRQPTGAQDAYSIGDKVHYPGAEDPVYVSTVNDNVWAPDVYGWEQE